MSNDKKQLIELLYGNRNSSYREAAQELVAIYESELDILKANRVEDMLASPEDTEDCCLDPNNSAVKYQISVVEDDLNLVTEAGATSLAIPGTVGCGLGLVNLFNDVDQLDVVEVYVTAMEAKSFDSLNDTDAVLAGYQDEAAIKEDLVQKHLDVEFSPETTISIIEFVVVGDEKEEDEDIIPY